MPALHKYKDQVVQSNAKGVEFLFKKNGVTLLPGARQGRRGRGSVQVTPAGGGAGRHLHQDTIVLRMGSVIRGPPLRRADGKKILNSDHALTLKESRSR